MEQRTIESWEAFDEYLKELEAFRSQRCQQYQNNAISNWVHRGQSDSEWRLATTLERSGWAKEAVSDYYRLIRRSQPQIESLSGNVWDPIDLLEVEERIRANGIGIGPDLPAYEYMVYLRHHGFPSPLLDWSISPYVALQFAFMDQSNAPFVSVYSLMEYSTGTKMSDSSKPRIEQFGPYVRAHRRHAIQQSVYTICTAGHGVEQKFAEHDSIHDGSDQDLVKKINIRSDLRIEFMTRMDRFNLNPFGLYGSEDGLVRSIAFREMFIR